MWRDAGYDYTGLDFTDKFLSYGRKLYPHIKQVVADASKTSLSGNSYDTVYAKDLLEHLPPEKYKGVLAEMWRLAGKVMMVAFYIAPRDKPTRYELVKNLHYKNRYNKQEVLNEINALKPRSVEVYEHIGYNNSALYVVKKQWTT